MFTGEYEVNYILYRNEETGFTIFQAKKFKNIDDDTILPSITCKGIYQRIENKDCFSSKCEWVIDKKYGKQVATTVSNLIIPSNLSGIERFLKRCVKGVGPTTAKAIVKKYGEQTIEKIKGDICNLTCIKGVSQKKAIRIREQIIKHDSLEKLSIFLFSHGVTNYNDVVTIYEKLKDEAYYSLLSNPYCLCELIGPSYLPIADKIALSTNFNVNDSVRIEKIVGYFLYTRAFKSGDIFFPFNELYTELNGFIRKNKIAETDISKEDLLNILKESRERSVFYLDFSNDCFNPNVYLHKLYNIESGTASCVKKLSKPRIKPLNDKVYYDFFEKYTKENNIIMDDTQIRAVKNTYENQFSILTGGPGTGKTQTLKAILHFYKKFYKDAKIVLCAPTGRASRRMSEITGQEAYTIHRFLGIRSDETLEVDNEIDADLIICDESSMIDSQLFYKLVKAVADTKTCSLLLVGDHNQLPPVGPGFPFKELCYVAQNYNNIPIVVLERLFRQAAESQINTNARKVLEGIDYVGNDGLSFDINKQDFFFFPSQSPARTIALILKSIEQLTSLGTNIDDIVILSSMRKSPIGIEAINVAVQEFINPPSHNKVEFKSKIYTLREGDRVMQTNNDYDLGVFNGDVGHIKKIFTEDEELVVDFDGNEVLYSFNEASSLELAYSITVHKSQGAEFNCVIMPFGSSLVNLSRSIIYTSFSRAKKRFVCIGESESLFEGIGKIENMKRFTSLSDMLIPLACRTNNNSLQKIS